MFSPLLLVVYSLVSNRRRVWGSSTVSCLCVTQQDFLRSPVVPSIFFVSTWWKAQGKELGGEFGLPMSPRTPGLLNWCWLPCGLQVFIQVSAGFFPLVLRLIFLLRSEKGEKFIHPVSLLGAWYHLEFNISVCLMISVFQGVEEHL